MIAIRNDKVNRIAQAFRLNVIVNINKLTEKCEKVNLVWLSAFECIHKHTHFYAAEVK